MYGMSQPLPHLICFEYPQANKAKGAPQKSKLYIK